MAFNERVALVAACRREALEHTEGGDRLPCERIVGNRHLLAVPRTPRDARRDGARIECDTAVHERDVATVEGACANKVL